MATRFQDNVRNILRTTLLLCACAASVATSRLEHWYQDVVPLDLTLDAGESVDLIVALDARVGAIPTGTDGAGFQLNAPVAVDAQLLLLPDPDDDPDAPNVDLGLLTLDADEVWQDTWDHDPLADCPTDTPCSRDYLLTLSNTGTEAFTETLGFSLFIDAPFDGEAVRPSPTNLRLLVERVGPED